MISNSMPHRRSWSMMALGLGVGATVLTGCGSGNEGGSASAEGSGSEEICATLEGEAISLVVPFGPGAGYDEYARILAPYLQEEIGATISVINQPGAGGLLALNNVLSAEPDGTTIAIMNGVGAGTASLAGASGADFSLDDFTIIGRLASDPPLVVTSATGPYQTFDEVREAEDFRWGASGPGGETYVNVALLTSVFDMEAELSTGFSGTEEIDLSLLQGDVDGMSGSASSRISAITQEEQTPVLLLGAEAPEWLSEEVPLISEIDMSDTQANIMDAHQAVIEVGRPLVAPAGMDENTTTCLREALAATMENEELLSEAEQRDRAFDFLTGEEAEELVQQIMEAPEEYRELLETLY